ncbi:MAG: orotidine-5'-phosphate decarboxylase [Myxococcales bacterium]|nr:orotidine-5'-phosphate decarboxylase [Polyangiaceae bacterium]MDW8248548.1 orotidine-5'-phosphate decarboxylase [Myxococcales bacterium]
MTHGDVLAPYPLPRPAHRLVLALDFPSWNEALPLAERLAPEVGCLKIGLELFLREGPTVVREASRLAPVFLDLKLHDIPRTIDHATASALASGARLLSLHAAAGHTALQRAARRTEGTSLIPVAVTVLTSLSADDLRQLGVDNDLDTQVLCLARLAWEAGIRAFVTSPREVGLLRRAFPGALLITPGIRAQAGGDDQQRTACARDAIAAGSDLLVVGRPLRHAADPVQTASVLAEEIRKGLEQRQSR